MAREKRKTALVSFRTEPEIKGDAQSILDRTGLNMSVYLDLALRRLVEEGKVPFTLPGTKDDDRAA